MTEERASMLDPALATPVGLAISAGVLMAWLATHRFKGLVSPRPIRLFFFLFRCGLAAVAIWLLASLAARFFTLGFVLPLSMISLLGAFVIESVIALTAFERGMVSQLRGRWLLGSRLAAVLWLVVALLEPLSVNSTTRKWQREVAVIVDESDSMHLVDEHATLGYDLEVAELFGSQVASGRPRLNEIADELHSVLASLQRGANGFFDDDQLEQVSEATKSLPGALDKFDPGLRGLVLEKVREIDRAQRSGDAPAIDLAEKAIGESLRAAMAKLGASQRAAETSFLQGLTADQRYELAEAVRRTRAQIARQSLSEGDGNLIEELNRNYKLRFYFAGADLVPANRIVWEAENLEDDFRDSTDLGGALNSVLQAVPPHLLAGAVVVSDGANNAGIDLGGPARGFALREAPVGAIALGGSSGAGTVDAAITGIHAPRRLILGENLSIDADIHFQNMAGLKAHVVLKEGDNEIERKPVDIHDPDQRVSLNFELQPQKSGVKEYQIEVVTEGEIAEQVAVNNRDQARVNVLEEDHVDALDVLLADSFPRWEFRYLRNLFDGRDESVRLQHLLFRPEKIAGVKPLPAVAASTTRAFGDSRASELPKSAAEWSAFEVIVIGDVTPEHVSAEQWAIIEETVDKSGAMLVLIAGKKAMPHGIKDPNLRALLPTVYQAGMASPSPSESMPYAIRWTPAGFDSQLNNVSSNPQTTRDFWEAIPPIQWRHPVAAIKPSAEVLAYAEPIAGAEALGVDLDELVKRNALIVTQRYGKGRVVVMNFDRSYRMRFGFGERFHHRFWWQLIHWRGAEEFNLESLVELKIDRENYVLGSPVKVVAKAIDKEDEALAGPLSVKVVDMEGKEVLRQTLVPRVGGHGVFEANLHDIPAAGSYKILLEGEGILELLSEDKPQSVSATFKVEPPKPVELRNVAAQPGTLTQLARRTGGRVARLGDASSLMNLFGDTHLRETTTTENSIWDQPIFLLGFVILLAAEWILRRQSGLP